MLNTENKLVGLIGRIRLCRYLFCVLYHCFCRLLFSERTNEVRLFGIVVGVGHTKHTKTLQRTKFLNVSAKWYV
jgi:hypothetical protein